ncbi:MAG: CBS domain-containing protein [Euryarchaeota archaeon]|nr:CBS domain-containing protein [Euryarchaeota archaeon]
MTVVRDVMTHKPIVSTLPGTRTDVLKLMVKHNLTGVPLVKRDGKRLAGLVTRRDILNSPEEEQLVLIMQRDPVCISSDASVEDAAKLMSETMATHLPVIEDERLIGIITPTDLLYEVEKRASNIPIEELVLSPCVPIYSEAPLMVAFTTFRVTNVDALPVLDAAGQLNGILTDRDIFNKFHIHESVLEQDMGLGGEDDNWSWENYRNILRMWYQVSKIDVPMVPVSRIMTDSPVTVFKRTSVSDAARTMRRNDFGQLPVVDSRNMLTAMLYDLDIISILAD